MKAGLVSITFRGLTPAEVIRVAVENGLAGIEWGGDVHVPHGDLEAAAEVARLTAAAGLEVAAYGSYYRFEECDLDASVGGPTLQSVLDTAEVLGAPAIRVWAGQRGPAETSPAAFAVIAGRAREFAEACARRGMRLDFEFHGNTLTETAGSTCRLLEAIDHPAAHSLWQPALQTPPADRLASLREVKPWVSNIHCNHFAQDPWPHIHALAEGANEWMSYLSELKPWTNPYWILLEHVRDHSVEHFRKDAATLRGWLAT